MSNYKVIYNLLPSNATRYEEDFVRLITTDDRQTIGYSADDAGRLVLSGNLNSRVQAWEPERIGSGLTQAWFDQNYPGVTMVAKYFNANFEFSNNSTLLNYITQPFGANPEIYNEYGLPGHDGIDYRAATGEPIFCVSPGFVCDINTNPNGKNYGIYIRVQHVGGFETTYAHLERVLLKVGDYVTAGSILGLADSTGNSTGSHLHLTLKNYDWNTIYPYHIIDPTPYLYE